MYFGSAVIFQEFEYQMVKVNVDNLRLIQVGITLSDAAGRVPPGVCSWQFNMHFDIRY